ncbi:aldo/keto reductase [Burkholderia sp. Bp8998]|uniref:aldo/keto reductase n=1 Tax=Burkholderia sp. Bp8998 TaxID=2184557 RepID=UPI000F5ACCB4|nr:aldo/keto reductase [Burkholderia sp. Bp8998]RQS14476.1 aldo/keto reductase [Burkholderia sp. Bp8998]
MKYRTLGRTGWSVSTVSFGAWAIGGSWGAVDDREAMRTLHTALDCGVNFFDTADVYGDGRSERLIGALRRERHEPFYVATKAGLRLDPHVADGYNRTNLLAFVDRSLQNLNVDVIDLLQLHSPPTDVYYRPEVFGTLEDLIRIGKIRFAGVSVNRVEEGLKAIDFPVVQSVQVVYNIFRQRPNDLFLAEARRRGVGVMARLPLSSGLLTGKLTKDTRFDARDHRAYNQHGEAFDPGDTFSGVAYDVAVDVVQELTQLVPVSTTMAQWALRWILMNEAVTCVIPGGRKPSQVMENIGASDLLPLSADVMAAVQEIYNVRIKPLVHARW